MGTRSWDTDITPIDDSTRATVLEVLAAGLVDDLEVLGQLVHGDAELDRKQLSDRADEAMRMACALLDLIAPVPATD